MTSTAEGATEAHTRHGTNHYSYLHYRTVMPFSSTCASLRACGDARGVLCVGGRPRVALLSGLGLEGW